MIKDAFNLFDADGSGTVSKDELSRVMETLFGTKLDASVIDDMIRDVDVDNDGEINFEEFVDQLSEMMNEPDPDSYTNGNEGEASFDGENTSNASANEKASKGQWRKLGTLIKTFQENRTENKQGLGLFSAVGQKHVEKQERKKVLSKQVSVILVSSSGRTYVLYGGTLSICQSSLCMCIVTSPRRHR